MANANDSIERFGVYKGPIPHLKGFRAKLITYPATGRCLAVFEDTDSGYVGRVADFETAHFELED